VQNVYVQEPPAGSKRIRNVGFSLLELTVVVGAVLVVSAITIPNMVTVVSNARLHAGLTSMSGLLQNCRMLAVKKNRTLTTIFEAEDEDALVGYVKDVTDSTPRKTSDPQVKWEAPIAMLTAPTGPQAPPALTTSQIGFTPETVLPSFNARGLPCVYDDGACTNHGFLYYFKDTSRGDGRGWAALSITPAGRIKKWYWSGSSWTD